MINWKSIIKCLICFAIMMILVLSLIGILSKVWLQVLLLALGIKMLARPSHNTVTVGLTLIISSIIGFVFI